MAVRCGAVLPANPRYRKSATREQKTKEAGGVEWSGVQVQVAGGRRERQMILRLRKRFPLSFFSFLSLPYFFVRELKNRRYYDGELMLLFDVFVPPPSRPASLIGAN